MKPCCLVITCLLMSVFSFGRDIIYLQSGSQPKSEHEAIVILAGLGSKVHNERKIAQYFKNKGYDIYQPSYIPEGSRGEPEKFQKFKRGVGLVMEQCPDIPFIPFYMKGLGKILPKGDPVPVPFDSYMYIGSPVFPKGKTADEIVNEVEAQIHALKNEFS